MRARSLLARVQRLEERRTPTSPIARWFGSVDAFTDEFRAGIAAGTYDMGVETITAESITITDRRTIYTHPVSGAQSHVLTVARKDRIRPLRLPEALAIARAEPQSVFLVNTRSNRAAIQLPTASDSRLGSRSRSSRTGGTSSSTSGTAATAFRPTPPGRSSTTATPVAGARRRATDSGCRSRGTPPAGPAATSSCSTRADLPRRCTVRCSRPDWAT